MKWTYLRTPRLLSFSLFIAMACSDAFAGSITSPCASEIPTFLKKDTNKSALHLAITLSDTLYPDEGTYRRLLLDTKTISRQFPELRKISHRGRYDFESLLITTRTPAAAQSFLAGDDRALNCLNNRFEVKTVRELAPNIISIRFSHSLNTKIAANIYGDLPEVALAEPNTLIGGGSTICAITSNSVWEYLVIEGAGDCPAGCTNFTYHYFRSTAAGHIERIDVARDGDKKDWIQFLKVTGSCR